MKIWVCTLIGAIIGLTLTGCGGGGGRAAAKPAGKTLTTVQATAPLRNARSALAITGLGLKAATRALTIRMGSRAAMLLKATRARTRSATSGHDPDTLLYYVITNYNDGSGIENLYSDSSDTTPAGSFVWDVVHWHNGVANTYPALYHVTYSITAGPFAGDHGTLDVTVNDALGHNGAIHILNTNKQGEHCDATENLANDVITAAIDISFPDGSTCTGSDTWGTDGSINGDYTFNDGNQETVDMQPDGSGTEALTAPDGSDQATGDFNSEGNVDIQYDDGSSADVNVDTGDTSDSGGDSGDSSDNSQ
jgi:hypothetical protein